ncbi:hypothetical protein [Chroococcidiopsis cubana]|nr:hypothetical protein [Chroococcidiopsis cubana]
MLREQDKSQVTSQKRSRTTHYTPHPTPYTPHPILHCSCAP